VHAEESASQNAASTRRQLIATKPNSFWLPRRKAVSPRSPKPPRAQCPEEAAARMEMQRRTRNFDEGWTLVYM